MLSIVNLDEPLRGFVATRAREDGILAHQHPAWCDVFQAMNADCRGLVALRHGLVVGWVLYSVFEGLYGTIVNSMPLIAYGGPAVPDADPAVEVCLLKALRDEAERLEADVLTVSTSPFLTAEREDLYRRTLAVTHELENFVQLQHLDSHPIDQLSSPSRANFQRELKIALQNGLQITRELPAERLEEWLMIYRTRYSEIGARPYPDEFHRQVYRQAIPAGIAEFWSVFDGDVLVGGTVFLNSGTAVDYFSSVFRSDYRHLSPNTYLLNEAFTDFRRRGVRYFNWQSSPGKDGVYKYKARWGAYDSRHFYLSVLLRSESRLLCAPVTQVRESYPLRFVLPHSAWPSLATNL